MVNDRFGYLFSLLLLCLVISCNEVPPQWRDDQAMVDEETAEGDVGNGSDGEQDDLFDDPGDDTDPDADLTADCNIATPTVAEKNALESLFSGSGMEFCSDKTVSGAAYFVARRDGETIGYAFPASHYGFDGPVVALTGMTTDAKSIAVSIVSQYESWWFRMGQWFFDQFKGIDITKIALYPKYDDNCWPCSEMYDAFSPYTVDAVSGATYTSNAVTKDVWDAFYLYDEVFDPPAR